MRTLVVGNIHGCWDEFQALLDRAGLAADDAIISVGDMVNRGPESPRVLAFFRDTPNARAIMGNHEMKHLLAARGEKSVSKPERIARLQFGDDYDAALDYMASLPAYIELPQVDIVHAFFEPGVPLAQQREDVLVGMDTGDDYLRQKLFEQPWYEAYDGVKPLLVGHRAYLQDTRPLLYPPAGRPRVYGLDTGCVYGGLLTGLILPEFRLISVISRANYWAQVRRSYSRILDD